MHMFEIYSLDIGMGDFIGRKFLYESALPHDSNAITRLFGAKQIMGGH